MTKALIAVIVFSFVVMAIAPLLIFLNGALGLGQKGGTAIPIAGALVAELSLLGAAWWFGVKQFSGGWRSLGFAPYNSRIAIPLILLVLILGLTTNVVYVLLITWLGLDLLQPSSVPTFLKEGGTSLILGAILALLTAPIVEEAFFRGFLFAGIARRYGVAWGASLSALAFALSHLQIGIVIPVFVLGLLLAWLYIRTNSIWPCIMVHFTYNALALSTIVSDHA